MRRRVLELTKRPEGEIFMARVEETPGWWGRLCGKSRQTRTYCGRGRQWVTGDGAKATSAACRFLDGVLREQPPEAVRRAPQEPVQEASEESFPASDPPAWTKTSI